MTDLIAKLRATNDFSQRYQLENQISQTAKPAHIPLLIREIETGPDPLRPHFIRPIGEIGGKEAVGALRAILTRHSWTTRGHAASTLKRLGDEGGFQYLVAEFAKPELTTADRQAIVQYLYVYYSPSKEATAALRKALELDRDASLRRRIIEALVSHKDGEAMPLLRKIASDPADPSRADAIAGLVKLGDSEALDRAFAELANPKTPTATLYSLIQALRDSGHPSVADRFREVLEKIEDASVKAQILRSLSDLKDPKAAGLFARYARDADKTVASAALDALLKTAGKGQIEMIRDILKHEEADLRLRAAEALFTLDDDSGLPVVEAEINEAAGRWRVRAVGVLDSWRRKESVPILLKAMAAPEADLRKAATPVLLSTFSALFPYLAFDFSRSGYDPSSPDAAARAAGLEKIQRWWDENRSR